MGCFKTENVTNMGGMFGGCSSLTSLDLSSFKTSKMRNIGGMFQGCTNLTTIYASEGWITPITPTPALTAERRLLGIVPQTMPLTSVQR